MTQLFKALGGRKYVAYLVTVTAIALKAGPIPDLDVEGIIAAGVVYVAAEGAADVVGRWRNADSH